MLGIFTCKSHRQGEARLSKKRIPQTITEEIAGMVFVCIDHSGLVRSSLSGLVRELGCSRLPALNASRGSLVLNNCE
jgi:hypothetical protein